MILKWLLSNLEPTSHLIYILGSMVIFISGFVIGKKS
jgi:hypothetical protein